MTMDEVTFITNELIMLDLLVKTIRDTPVAFGPLDSPRGLDRTVEESTEDGLHNEGMLKRPILLNKIPFRVVPGDETSGTCPVFDIFHHMGMVKNFFSRSKGGRITAEDAMVRC